MIEVETIGMVKRTSLLSLSVSYKKKVSNLRHCILIGWCFLTLKSEDILKDHAIKLYTVLIYRVTILNKTANTYECLTHLKLKLQL